MPPEVAARVPAAEEEGVVARPISSPVHALSSGAERARDSDGDGGAMSARGLHSRFPAKKLVLDSNVGDSKMAPPSAGFCRTSLLSPNDAQLDFFMTWHFFFFL
jgi:hypothetical protein